MTDTSGSFVIPLDYDCPSKTAQIYIVASVAISGSPSSKHRPALGMMSALGSCGSLKSNSYIAIDEVTTVLSVWALAHSMKAAAELDGGLRDTIDLSAAIHAGSADADQQAALTYGIKPASRPNASIDKINRVASIISACESNEPRASADGKHCKSLFALTKSTGEATSLGVLSAAFSNSGNSKQQILKRVGLLPATGSSQPVLSVASVSAPRVGVSTEPRSGIPLGQESLSQAKSGTNLKFVLEPAGTHAGSVMAPTSVLVEDANGSVVKGATNQVTLNLQPGEKSTVLQGTRVQSASRGQATFFDLTMASTGARYKITATSDGLGSATSTAFDVTPSDSSFSFKPPAANECQSNYDQFYIAEPGVYSFWALCEHGKNPAIYDYAGKYDLRVGAGAWSAGAATGGVAGPVPDAETSVQVSTASSFIEGQGIPLNTNAGSLSAWINAEATPYRISAVLLSAVSGASSVSLSVRQASGPTSGSLCYAANYQNSLGVTYSAQQCGFTSNQWHRLAMTWSAGKLVLYVDGLKGSESSYFGTLENKVFYYKLFPGCCDTGKQMTLAKVIVANQAWTAAQAALDDDPAIIAPPTGGVYVSGQTLGTIHRDVLGYADDNSDLSSVSLVTALKAGLHEGGFSSLRYAGGSGGIGADQANWQGGSSCTSSKGKAATLTNISTNNNLDSYVTQIAQPLGLHLGYTVNYGTNPPSCNAGGDPVTNGANLVAYANRTKQYGIKYWEIGNEQFAAGSGGTETDFHSNPGTGASYVAHEPAFVSHMKAQDNSILVGVPIGEATYAWQSEFDLPVLAAASYDAIVWHSYPLLDPITDGATAYQERVGSNTQRTRATLLKLQTELLNNGKSPDAIWVTEWNGDESGDKWSRQTLGAVIPIFGVMQLAEFMQAGVQYATWWAQGTSNACYLYYYDWTAESSYNWADCGGASLIYTGSLPGEVNVGLVAGNITPAARAFQMLSESGFVTEGEHMLRTQSDVQSAPWLMSYAATHGSSYAVILINRDRDNSHIVPVMFAGKASGASVIQWSYGRTQYDETYFGDWSASAVESKHGAWSGSYTANLAPWSVNIIVFGK